ncbi:unnamed protein product [Amaranthus hypochondriacus]
MAQLLQNKSKCVEKYGPYGNQSGQQWSMMLEPNEIISEIILRTGAVIDSIAFITAKPSNCGCGWTASHRKFGGNGGNSEYKITLRSGEYITHISGAIGTWEQKREVAKLRIHTNLCPAGYGPYGGGPYTHHYSEFSSPIPSSGRVSGFFGTLDHNYIQSIGIYG